MNRRNLLKAIPSASLLSLTPDLDLRKLYLKFIFPSQFTVESMEIGGEVYYSAVWLDPPDGNQYYYHYDTHEQTHKYVVQFLKGGGEAENLEVACTETTYRAYKEIEKYLP